ncbi:MAG: hypothetical protein HQM08_25700 [Candidatus Riflebacteria bacterium]|nr:hypothetical protein [Candidatus Riflebacteria bacterium]
MKASSEILKIIKQAEDLRGKVSSKQIVLLFEESLIKFPDSAHLYLNLHFAYYEAGLDALEMAIKLDPNIKENTEIYAKKSISLEEKKDLAQLLGNLLKEKKI